MGRGRPRESSAISLAGCRRLDRRSGVPLYYQLAATVYEQLELGDWPEGTRFPTERELEAEFNVSRAVVRRALELLAADGAIERTQGRGAFLAPPRIPAPIAGLLDLLIHGRDGIEIEVISIRTDPTDPAIAEFLSLRANERAIARIVVVLHAPTGPVAMIDSHTPVSRLPWLAEAAGSIAEAGVHRVTPPVGLGLTRAEVLTESTSFSSWSAPILGAKAADPAFMSRVIQYGLLPRRKTERPLEFARLVSPSDRTRLSSELATDPLLRARHL